MSYSRCVPRETEHSLLYLQLYQTCGFPNRPLPTVDKLVFFLVPECILYDLVIYFSIAFLLFEIEELDFNFGNKKVPRIQIQSKVGGG